MSTPAEVLRKLGMYWMSLNLPVKDRKPKRQRGQAVAFSPMRVVLQGGSAPTPSTKPGSFSFKIRAYTRNRAGCQAILIYSALCTTTVDKDEPPQGLEMAVLAALVRRVINQGTIMPTIIWSVSEITKRCLFFDSR